MDRQAAEAITRRIRESVDVVDLISDHVKLKRQGANFVGLCPFHQEKDGSFNVNPSRQIFKCFGCGVGGDVFTFVQLHEKVDFLEARQILANRAGIELESWSGGGGERGPARSDLCRANVWAQDQFRTWLQDPELGKVARDYVVGRQLDQERVEAFGLGYAPPGWDAIDRAGRQAGFSTQVLLAAGLIRSRSTTSGTRDTFHNRLMFPIRDASGQVIGFGGRTLGDDKAKYLNTPETALFEKGKSLYGLDLARKAIVERNRVVVVEGYTDCMMAHQFGFAETVATLGTALTPDHVRVLRRYTDNTILVFDSDEAGERAADRGLEVFLTQELDVRLARVPEGKDPCDFLLAQGAEAFEALLDNASGALESKWQSIRRRYEAAGSGPGRRQAIEEFLGVVATSSVYRAVDPVRQGLVVTELAKLLGMQIAEVNRQLVGVGRRIRRRAVGHERPGVQDGEPPASRVEMRVDAEQRALREVLEVLVNEPGYCSRVRSWYKAHRIEDDDLRAVAATVMAMADALDEFHVGELISKLEDPRYARLVTDLQHAGEARGNYEATIASSRHRLTAIEEERSSKEAAERLYRSAGELSASDQDSLLEEVASRARRRKETLPMNLTTRRFGSDRPQESA